MSDVLGKATIMLAAEAGQFNADMVNAAHTVRQFQNTATQSAGKSAAALTAIGAAVGQSAESMTAKQRLFADTMQRQVAVLEGGKIAGLELKAAQLGMSQTMAPLIERFRAAEAAQRSIAAASGSMGAATWQASGALTALAESEAQATARIRAMVAASQEESAALHATAAAADRVAASLRSASSSKQQYAGKTATTYSGQAGMASTRVTPIDFDDAGAAAKRMQDADKFVASLKRQAETAGMTRKEMLEWKAAQLGVTGEASPFIAKLADAEKGMHGFSLKTSGARRELAVMTREIAAGNFSGLARSFSIFSESSGLTAKILSPLGLSIGAAAAAVGLFGAAAYQGAKEVSALNRSLIVTGGYAGSTSGTLMAMADRLGAVNKNTGVAVDVLSGLVGSGRVSGQVLESVGQAAINMSKLTGEGADKVVSQFAGMSDGVVKFADDFDKKYHMLSLAVYEQISALERQGNTQQAQEVMTKAIASEAQRRIDALRANLNDGQKAWEDLGNAALTAWAKMKSATVVAVGMAPVEQELAWRKDWKAGNKTGDNFFGSMHDAFSGTDNDKRIAELEAKAKKIVNDAKAAAEKTQVDAAGKSGFSGLMTLSTQIDKAYQLKTALAGVQKQWDDLNKADPGLKKLRIADPDNPLLQPNALQNLKDAERKKIAGSGGDRSARKLDNAYQTTLSHLGTEGAKLDDQIAQYEKFGKVLDQSRAAALEFDLAQGKLKGLSSKQIDTLRQLAGADDAKDVQRNALKGIADTEKKIAAIKAETAAIGMGNQAKEMAVALADMEAKGVRAGTAAYVEESARLKKAIADRSTGKLTYALQMNEKAQAESIAQTNAEIALIGLSASERKKAVEVMKLEAAARKLIEANPDGANLITASFERQKEAVQASYDAQAKSQAGWIGGATSALADYDDMASNVAAQSASAVTSGMKSMEDAFASFAATGKLSFSSLATSVIADIARMQAKAAISGLFNFAIGVASRYFGSTSSYGAADGAQAASGGGFNLSPQFKADGGFISGPGTGTSDSIAAWLSNGEFVNNAESTKKNRGLLEWLNKGGDGATLGRFASGGLVGSASMPAGVLPSAGAGGGFNINTYVTVSDTGTKSDTTGDNSSIGKQLGAMISQAVKEALIRESRDGGLLSKQRMGYA